MDDRALCKDGEIFFENELFRVSKVKRPECLKNHFIVESTRRVSGEEELSGREKFWLELTVNSARNYFEKRLGLKVASWQLLVDFCSPHYHLHLFQPVEFWQVTPAKLTSIALGRVREIQRRYAGLEAEL